MGSGTTTTWSNLNRQQQQKEKEKLNQMSSELFIKIYIFFHYSSETQLIESSNTCFFRLKKSRTFL